jgi:type I restriction-modification system DNA methylase subunit
MTIRNFLLKELEKRGVKVDTEVTYTTPIGRLMPDMLLHNGAQYVVETKLGAEAKLLDAMVRLYDYSKYTQAKGAFAVLFPKELRQPWNIEILEKISRDPKLEYVATATFKDLRPSQRFAGNLSQIADWMASQVLRPLVVEADTSFAIKVLTEAVASITASVRRLKGKELEDIFGGKTVFENILQYKEGRYPLEEMRQAATYLLVNQIIFYHVLSRMDTTFEAIDEDKIGKPNDLLRYFKPVLERDYSSVFGFDVASRLPESATRIVRKVIMTVKALAPEKIGQDVLGKVFHELIPFNIRKAVAAFYTNNEAAEILAQLAIEKPDAKVIDLAVGSGTLLVAAYRRKRELLRTGRGGISLEDHKRFLEHDLTGIDIMPFAAHLAVMHLSLQALLHETEKVRIAVWDSTELKPDMTIPAIYSELKAAYRRPTLDMFKEGAITPREAYINKGAITLEGVGGEEIPLEKADVVIMNPPFTRQERLPLQYKESLNQRLKEYSEKLHGQLGFHGYFIFLADKFLKPNGRLALVLPATVLRLGSTQGIRELLTEKFIVEYIITTSMRSAFSEAAQFREILLVARKRQEGTTDNTTDRCALISLKRLPRDLGEAREFASSISGLKNQPLGKIVRNLFSALLITQRDLKENVDNMFRLIATSDLELVELWSEIKDRTQMIKLSTVLANEDNLARGFEMTLRRASPVSAYTTVIIRDAARALKKHDQWIVKNIAKNQVVAENRFTHETVKIPRRALIYALRRLSGVKTLDLSETLDLMVIKPFRGCEILFAGKTNLERSFRSWRRYAKSRKTNLVFIRRFNLSAPRTILFAHHSPDSFTASKMMYCFRDVSESDAKILTMWLNSTLNVLQVFLDRNETEGAFISLPKYSLMDMWVLDPRKLSKKERSAILHLYDKIKAIEFPSLLKQLKDKFSARIEIDRLMLGVLGFVDDEIGRILDYLYPALANEIEQLKTLMAG